MDADRLAGMMNLADSEAREKIGQAIFRKESLTAGMPEALNLNQSGTFNQDQAVSLLTLGS